MIEGPSRTSGRVKVRLRSKNRTEKLDAHLEVDDCQMYRYFVVLSFVFRLSGFPTRCSWTTSNVYEFSLSYGSMDVYGSRGKQRHLHHFP